MDYENDIYRKPLWDQQTDADALKNQQALQKQIENSTNFTGYAGAGPGPDYDPTKESAPADVHSMDWGQLAEHGASMFGGGKVDSYPTLKPQGNTVQSGGIGKYRSALMSFI
jgi:hypothetical protein